MSVRRTKTIDEGTRPGRIEQTELLAAFRDGNRDAFPRLIRPQLGSLLALARRLAADEPSAEDLVQETLIRAFENLAEFRGESALRTWLLRILVRLSSRPARRTTRTESLPADVPSHLPDDPIEQSMARELRDRLAEAMERLPPRQRAALHLRAVEGLDYQTIAEVLSCSRPAARVAVLAARRSMQQRIGRHLEP